MIYVNAGAVKSGDGTKEYPFKSLNEAARIARAGDLILVAPGVYREFIDPRHGGCENARITYVSETPLGAVITGAEDAKGWKPYEGNVWVYRVKNSMFGDYNPYGVSI